MKKASILKVPCPSCKKQVAWQDNPFRPFCSERCKNLDFGDWILEKHRIEPDPDDDGPDEF